MAASPGIHSQSVWGGWLKPFLAWNTSMASWKILVMGPQRGNFCWVKNQMLWFRGVFIQTAQRQPLEICSCRVDSIYGGRVEKGILRDWLLDNLFWSSQTWGQKKRSTTTTTSYKPQWGPLYSQHDFCSCRLTSWSSSPRATQTKGSVLKTKIN